MIPIPDTYWDKTVAMAAPSTPQAKTSTKSKSKRIFKIAEIAKKSSGAMEFPTARNKFAK